jgi:hypothetical protein
LQLFKTALDLEDWTLGCGLLDPQALDLLLDLFKVVLLSIDKLLDIIMLLLDLTEFLRDLTDLILVVLHGGRIICRFKEGVLFNEAV